MSETCEFKNAPIAPAWILAGSPRARVALLSGSTDGTSFTVMWDCTAGRFNWFYAIDETVYILEGAVTLTLPSGATRQLVAGSNYFFARGTQAQWQIDSYVRKVAFCQEPMSGKLMLAARIFRGLKRVVVWGPAPKRGLRMFETS
ncbi:MAG TPA: cupin domain-containing protein [Steroidobacteraceae bacterium]|nr:cupin domain-containing protein [Steroidobacteraceae bacterium]